ncbi:MAG: hypothetical protein ABIA76_00050 [Candidatus Diapherotrites archaeon]
MHLMRNFLLLFFLFLAVFVAVGAVNLNAFYWTAFNESFWLAALDETNAYASLSDGLSSFSSLKEAGVSISVSEDWIKQQSENIIPSFFNYLRGETKYFDAEISLMELKIQFLDSFIEKTKKEQSFEIPDCLPGQEFTLLDDFDLLLLKAKESYPYISDCLFEEEIFLEETGLPNCWPVTIEQKIIAQELMGSFAEENELALAVPNCWPVDSEQKKQALVLITSHFQGSKFDFPDSINVQELFELSSSDSHSNEMHLFEGIKEFAGLVFVISLVLILFFVLLILLILLVSRSFIWVGGVLLISGIISIIPLFFISFLLPQNLFPSDEFGLIQSIMPSLIEKFISQVQFTGFIYSGILIVIGAVFLLIGLGLFFLKSRIQKPDAEVKKCGKAHP